MMFSTTMALYVVRRLRMTVGVVRVAFVSS
jgi:hypothetical protein